MEGGRAGPDEATAEEAGAPPFVLDLGDDIETYAGDKDDALIVVNAWLLKRHGRVVSAFTNLGESDPEREPVGDTGLADLVQPFSSPQRIAILNALARRKLASSELAAETGLAGGQLYHHLKELTRAGLVRSAGRGAYEMTVGGLTTFVTLSLLSRARRSDGAGGSIDRSAEVYRDPAEGLRGVVVDRD